MLDIPVIDLAAGNESQCPLKQSASGLTLSLGEDRFLLIDDVLQLQQHIAPNKLETARTFSENGEDPLETSLPDEDALFSLFSRSRSPSHSGLEDINHDGEGDKEYPKYRDDSRSDVRSPESVYSLPEISAGLTETVEKNAALESEETLAIPTRPRITLRSRPQKEASSKPKVRLRLTQPKVNKMGDYSRPRSANKRQTKRGA